MALIEEKKAFKREKNLNSGSTFFIILRVYMD